MRLCWLPYGSILKYDGQDLEVVFALKTVASQLAIAIPLGRMQVFFSGERYGLNRFCPLIEWR